MTDHREGMLVAYVADEDRLTALVEKIAGDDWSGAPKPTQAIEAARAALAEWLGVSDA